MYILNPEEKSGNLLSSTFDRQNEKSRRLSDISQSSSNLPQETRVVNGAEITPLAIAFLQRATSSYLKIATNRITPTDRKAGLEFSKALFELNPGFSYQLITDIQVDNLEYYRSLAGMGVQVRHLENNKISFAFSANEYMTAELAAIEKQTATGASVPSEIIWSTKSDLILQAGQMFQMMWSMSIPAEVRIHQLVSGSDSTGETRLISDMNEVFRIGKEMTERCSESALLILASPKTVTRNSESFERLTTLQKERQFRIRVLSPEVNTPVMKILPGAEWRKIEPMNVSIIIYDMKDMFITQYGDMEANSTQTAVFSNIYTTNRHTIAGMASVFDALWKESELREMEERSRKQAQLLQDILTHDIRNYNQISRLSGELVLERLRAAGDLEGSGLVEDMLEAIDGASALAEKGKKLGKILSEENPELGPIDLMESIEKSMVLVRQAFSEKIIREETQLLEKRLVVTADDLLNEVFTNIFSNSAKYTDSKVVEIEIDAQVDGPYAKISIADNGAGIADEVRDKIFERFVAGARGSGLGMSIVHALVVNRYRGKVTAENRGNGSGAVVRIWLPLSESKENVRD